jgi:chaperonin cofactor prefoldin
LIQTIVFVSFAASTKELKLLQDGSKVYKLIGPALVKQDLPEALKNVTDRITFIEGKMYVYRLCLSN